MLPLPLPPQREQSILGKSLGSTTNCLGSNPASPIHQQHEAGQLLSRWFLPLPRGDNNCAFLQGRLSGLNQISVPVRGHSCHSGQVFSSRSRTRLSLQAMKHGWVLPRHVTRRATFLTISTTTKIPTDFQIFLGEGRASPPRGGYHSVNTHTAPNAAPDMRRAQGLAST